KRNEGLGTGRFWPAHGPFRTWSDVRLKSVVRTQADSAGYCRLWVDAYSTVAAHTLICPTGKSARIMSSPSRKNISLRGLVETPLVIPAVPPRIEGRIAIVT